MTKKKKKLKLISWNVNGLRAAVKKDFFVSFKQLNADIVALQETKLQEHQLTDEMKTIDGYEAHWSHAIVKKGYSGVGTYSRLNRAKLNSELGCPDSMMRGEFWKWILMILFFLMSISRTVR